MEIEVKVPKHGPELKQATKLLESVEKDLNWHEQVKRELTFTQRKEYILKVSLLLDAIGELSRSRFDVREEIESKYMEYYSNQPALGQTLWLKYYESLHKPYDKIKNKCFNLIEKIDPDNTIEVI